MQYIVFKYSGVFAYMEMPMSVGFKAADKQAILKHFIFATLTVMMHIIFNLKVTNAR